MFLVFPNATYFNRKHTVVQLHKLQRDNLAKKPLKNAIQSSPVSNIGNNRNKLERECNTTVFLLFKRNLFLNVRITPQSIYLKYIFTEQNISIAEKAGKKIHLNWLPNQVIKVA